MTTEDGNDLAGIDVGGEAAVYLYIPSSHIQLFNPLATSVSNKFSVQCSRL